MYLDFAIWFNNYVETLGEPTKMFVYLAFYVCLPLLCVALHYLDKKMEKTKEY